MKKLMIPAVVVGMLLAASAAHAAQPVPQGVLEYDEIQGWVTVDPQAPAASVSVAGQVDPEMND